MGRARRLRRPPVAGLVLSLSVVVIVAGKASPDVAPSDFLGAGEECQCGELQLPAATGSGAGRVAYPFQPVAGENAWMAWTCADAGSEATVVTVSGRTYTPATRNATRAWEPAARAAGIDPLAHFSTAARSVRLGHNNGALWVYGETAVAGSGASLRSAALHTKLVAASDDDGADVAAADFTYLTSADAQSGGDAACVLPYNATMEPGAGCSATATPGAGATVEGQVFVWWTMATAGAEDGRTAVHGAAEDVQHGLVEAALADILSGVPFEFSWVATSLPWTPVAALTDHLGGSTHLFLFYQPDSMTDPSATGNLRLSRVPLNAPSIRRMPQAAEYFAGLSDSGDALWAPAPAAAVAVAPSLHVEQPSVAWNDYLQAFILLTVGGSERSRGDDSDDDSRKVFLVAAPRVWGPWSQRTVVYHLPGGGPALSHAVLRPEFASDGGRRIYFTVNVGRSPPSLVELTLCSSTDAQEDPTCLSHATDVNASAPMTPSCGDSPDGDGTDIAGWMYAVAVGGGVVVVMTVAYVWRRLRERRRRIAHLQIADIGYRQLGWGDETY